MPFPEFPDDEDDFLEDDSVKDKVIHVRLLPITWVWVRYEAKRCKLRPSEWIREAVRQYEDDSRRDLSIRDKVVHIRVSLEVWTKLQSAVRSSDRQAADVVHRAINQKLIGGAASDSSKGKK